MLKLYTEFGCCLVSEMKRNKSVSDYTAQNWFKFFMKEAQKWTTICCCLWCREPILYEELRAYYINLQKYAVD